MKDNLNSQSLIKVNENSIFYKIKAFFKKLFRRKEEYAIQREEQVEIDNNDTNQNLKGSFRESIRNIENEETKLLELQKNFDNGEIDEEDLSQEQIDKLESLYNKQIAELEKSNESRKAKIATHKDGNKFLAKIKAIESEETKLLRLQKRLDNGEISEYDLSDGQIDMLLKLYQDQNETLEESNRFRKEKLLQYRKRMQSA